MQIATVHQARTLWFCNPYDFNPRGANLFPAIQQLYEYYKFKKFPDRTKETLKTGFIFGEGEFTTSKRGSVLITLGIYDGGITADTRSSTKDSDEFLMDLSTRLSENFGLPRYDEIPLTIAHYNQMDVYAKINLEMLNKFKEINKYLSDNVHGGGIYKFETGGISFWPEQTAKWLPSPFTIERAGGVPFSENRYSTRAALETEKHIELIEKMERILGK